MLGTGGVGKSALSISLTQGQFVSEYDPTIENSYRKALNMPDGSVRMLDIVDTAGQEEFIHMRDQYISNGDGFVIVYSVGAATSAERIPELYDRIKLVKNAETWPAVLCANKSDLPPSQREISQAAIADLSVQLGVPTFETSARTRQNVEETFRHLCQLIDEHAKKVTPVAHASTPATPKKNFFSRCVLL